MTDAEKTALIAQTYHALIAAEKAHPKSAELKVLHGHLKDCLDEYMADSANAAVVRPDGGGGK